MGVHRARRRRRVVAPDRAEQVVARTGLAAVLQQVAEQRAATHGSELVRQHAAERLGKTIVRDAAPTLLELLKDDSKRVRSMAQASLDQIAEYLDQRARWEQRFKKK